MAGESDFDHDDGGHRRQGKRDARGPKHADCSNKKQARLTRREQKEARAQEIWIAKVTPEAECESRDAEAGLSERELKDKMRKTVNAAKSEPESMEDTSENHNPKDRPRSKSAKSQRKCREKRSVSFNILDVAEPEEPPALPHEDAAAAARAREREVAMARRERELAEADAMEALRAEAAAATAAVALLGRETAKSDDFEGTVPAKSPAKSLAKHSRKEAVLPTDSAEEEDDLEGWTIL